MIFRYMEKHRVGILLVVLFTMLGFGFWSYINEFLARRERPGAEDAGMTMAEVKLFGETYEIPKEELELVGGQPISMENMNERTGNARLAQLIQQKIIDSEHAYPVPTTLYDRMIQEVIVDPAKRENNGKFTDADAKAIAARRQMTVPELKASLMRDLKMALTLREIDRAGFSPTTKEIFERYQEVFQQPKLQGIFWDADSYREEIQMDRKKDNPEELSAEGEKQLRAEWDKLSDEDKSKYNKKASLIEYEFFGFDFEQYKTDEELSDAFKLPNPTTGKSLKDLTQQYKLKDAELANVKLRLERYRALYGLAPDDDIQKALDERKKRWTQEVKILKLVKALHDGAVAQQKAGKEFSFENIAQENNLTYGNPKNKFVIDLNKPDVAFQSGSLFGLNAENTAVGDIYNHMAMIGVQSPNLFRGPVDQPGRHVASYRLLRRDRKPVPAFADTVKDDFLKQLETRLAEEKRDAAFAAFEEKLDAAMALKAAEEIKKIIEEKDKAIKEAIAGLDPESEEDKKKIEELTKEQEEDAESLIDEEKNKFRAEAFDEVMANGGDKLGLVVEEGFFNPFFAVREAAIPGEAPFEVKARNSLRREFGSLHDQAFRDEIHEIGEVSQVIESKSYKGMKGMAKLIAKRKPTLEEMVVRPRLMQSVEMMIQRDRMQDNAKSSMWTAENMKARNFEIKTDNLDKKFKKLRERKEVELKKVADFNESLRLRKEKKAKAEADARAAAAKKMQDAAQKVKEGAADTMKKAIPTSMPVDGK